MREGGKEAENKTEGSPQCTAAVVFVSVLKLPGSSSSSCDVSGGGGGGHEVGPGRLIGFGFV